MFHSTLVFRFIFIFYSFFYFSWIHSDLPIETVYLTWVHNPSTSMTIQWISQADDANTTIFYRTVQEPIEWMEIAGESFEFPKHPQYLIHRVDLKNLQPDKAYLFRLKSYEKEFRFRTVPINLENKDLCFVVGGDMYHDAIEFMATTCQQAARFNPDFALIGGDIAYAVGSAHLPIEKVERWIEWIKTWHVNMVSSQGNLIPVIAALGNHDLIGHYDQKPSQAAIFSALFPMPGKNIYNILDFNTYLSICILDSGHANSIAGKQTQWLQNVLKERQHITHRFAIYHVPAFPSIRPFHNRLSAAIRRHWVPIFEKEGIQTAFEHHDHSYKRTHPLLNNRIHPNGVVYIGDGAWGVEKPRQLRKKQKQAYIAKFLSERHFIVVNLTPTHQRFTSINDQGKVLDEYIKKFNLVKPTSHPVSSIKMMGKGMNR